VIDWDYGEFHGPEDDQAIAIAYFARTLQGIDYKVGPAVVIEDFDILAINPTTDSELLSPVRIAAKVTLMSRLKQMGDARVVLQSRTIAKRLDDERLARTGYYVPGPDHIRDATRHAIMALRRATQSDDFRDELWDRSICLL
jgi:hypothetical protein